MCTSTSLEATSVRFHPVPFHAAVCCQARGSYIVPGAPLLGAAHLVYGQLPRVHIKLPWGHLSMAFGLAEGNSIYKNMRSPAQIFTHTDIMRSRLAWPTANSWKQQLSMSAQNITWPIPKTSPDCHMPKIGLLETIITRLLEQQKSLNHIETTHHPNYELSSRTPRYLKSPVFPYWTIPDWSTEDSWDHPYFAGWCWLSSWALHFYCFNSQCLLLKT